jgi:hypothetical protein
MCTASKARTESVVRCALCLVRRALCVTVPSSHRFAWSLKLRCAACGPINQSIAAIGLAKTVIAFELAVPKNTCALRVRRPG